MPIFYKKSNHVLIQLESDDDWEYFLESCDGYLNDNHFKMLYVYLKGIVKTIVVEKGYCDADYRDTYYNFFAKKFAEYPSKTIRANFFNKKISKKGLFKLDKHEKQYIGFTVIRPNRVNPIGRTILNPKLLNCEKGYVCMAEYPVHILGAELVAKGFPYISQDSDVTVCAHAACWMIFRYFSQRYNRYSEIWPYELTQLTKDISQGRLVPSKGLTASQVTEMFSRFGFYPEIYIRNEQNSKLFDLILYQYVESGLPVVAGLTGHRHAITIIGHISDIENIKPNISATSYDYLTGFIANDDNHLPYHAIRKSDPQPDGYWSEYQLKDIDFFIVPLYEKIYLSAEHVNKLSLEILLSPFIGVNARSNVVKMDQLMTRIFLTSSKSYKKVRREKELPFNISKVYCESEMPKFIWICEISTPELYSSKQIIGEIIFDATANLNDRFAFLSIHYPDFLLLNDRNFLTDDPKRFSIHAVETDDLNPYHCYVNNLCEG
jgi:hypothetical protein